MYIPPPFQFTCGLCVDPGALLPSVALVLITTYVTLVMAYLITCARLSSEYQSTLYTLLRFLYNLRAEAARDPSRVIAPRADQVLSAIPPWAPDSISSLGPSDTHARV